MALVHLHYQLTLVVILMFLSQLVSNGSRWFRSLKQKSQLDIMLYLQYSVQDRINTTSDYESLVKTI